jgi:hypothetical protein
MDGIALYVKDTALRIQIIRLFHVYLHAEAQNCRLKNKPSGLFFNLITFLL